MGPSCGTQNSRLQGPGVVTGRRGEGVGQSSAALGLRNRLEEGIEISRELLGGATKSEMPRAPHQRPLGGLALASGSWMETGKCPADTPRRRRTRPSALAVRPSICRNRVALWPGCLIAGRPEAPSEQAKGARFFELHVSAGLELVIQYLANRANPGAGRPSASCRFLAALSLSLRPDLLA
jgi:hypothetical protein